MRRATIAGWTPNEKWPNGKEPGATERKYKIGYAETEEEAQAMCLKWNENNEEGKYSDKAEYENWVY